MLKDPATRLSPAQLEKNFADINPPLTEAQALEEGSRCLFCHDAPCIKACPTQIDVPQFIRQILTGNMRGSARTIPFLKPTFWGTVAPVSVPLLSFAKALAFSTSRARSR